MKSRLVFVIALIVAIGLPLTAMGQEKKDAGAVNITGCLNKGADADHYVIKDDKTGKEAVVMGDAAMLARHANNHQVTITGTMAKDKDKDVLRASNLTMIAVCKYGQEEGPQNPEALVSPPSARGSLRLSMSVNVERGLRLQGRGSHLRRWIGFRWQSSSGH